MLAPDYIRGDPFQQQTLIPGGDQELVVPEAAGAGVAFEIVFAEGLRANKGVRNHIGAVSIINGPVTF
tara:strand:+ start:3475 stop:3678 length:204 start_codon:yes stop_codon:yes gene_type:complete